MNRQASPSPATGVTPVPHAPSKHLGRLSVLACALLWSTSGLFVKCGAFDQWPDDIQGTLLAFWRALFAGLVLAPTIRRPRWRAYLVPLALCFTGMNITYLTAMVRTTAANAIWLQSTAPWWVFLFSVFLFREPIVRRDLIPLCFGVLGVSTILFFEVRGQAYAGVICGVGAGICYAGVIVFMRQLHAENPAWLVALNHMVAAIVLLPWVIHLDTWPSLRQLALLMGFGVVQMAIPYILLLRGLRAISSQEAIGIALVEPVLMPFWVFLVGFETPDWWTVLGASLILAGLVLRYVVWELWARHWEESRGAEDWRTID